MSGSSSLFIPSGFCSDGGTLRAPVPPIMGELALSEWMPDPTVVNDNAGEWFEVVSRTARAVDLNGLLAGGAALGTTPVVTEAGPCVTLPAGGRALFARNAVASANGGLPPVTATFSFALLQSNGTLQIGHGVTVLDVRTWATSTPGVSIMLDSDGTQCNAPTGVMAYNGTDIGTPGDVNTPPECP